MPDLVKSPELKRFAALLQVIREAAERTDSLCAQIASLRRTARATAPGSAPNSCAIHTLANPQTIALKFRCQCDRLLSAVISSSLSGKFSAARVKIAQPFESPAAATALSSLLHNLKRWLSDERRAKAVEKTGALSPLLERPDLWRGSAGAKITNYLELAALADQTLTFRFDALMFSLPEWGADVPGAPASMGEHRAPYTYRENIPSTVVSSWMATKRTARLIDDRFAVGIHEALSYIEGRLSLLPARDIGHRKTLVAGTEQMLSPLHWKTPAALSTFFPGSRWAGISNRTDTLKRRDGRAGIQTPLDLLRQSAISPVIVAPILPPSAFAEAPRLQRRAELASARSVVINSSPSITIHTDNATDVEHRVLDALTQHREALYDQWHREVRRRQRVEF